MGPSGIIIYDFTKSPVSWRFMITVEVAIIASDLNAVTLLYEVPFE